MSLRHALCLSLTTFILVAATLMPLSTSWAGPLTTPEVDTLEATYVRLKGEVITLEERAILIQTSLNAGETTYTVVELNTLNQQIADKKAETDSAYQKLLTANAAINSLSNGDTSSSSSGSSSGSSNPFQTALQQIGQNMSNQLSQQLLGGIQPNIGQTGLAALNTGNLGSNATTATPSNSAKAPSKAAAAKKKEDEKNARSLRG